MNRDKIFNLIICLTFSITLISIITALQLGLRYEIKEFSKETTEEVQLYSISTNKEYEGSFVLGSGSIDYRNI